MVNDRGGRYFAGEAEKPAGGAVLTDKRSKMKTIGAGDIVDFPVLGLNDVPVRVDTGAKTSSIHAEDIQLVTVDGIKKLRFTIPESGERTFETEEYTLRKVKSSTGESQERFAVSLTVRIFGEDIKSDFTLARRDKMKFPVLLGRRILKDRFVVDVSKHNLSYREKRSN